MSGFWKMSPTELFEWAAILGDEQEDMFAGMEPGVEVED